MKRKIINLWFVGLIQVTNFLLLLAFLAMCYGHFFTVYLWAQKEGLVAAIVSLIIPIAPAVIGALLDPQFYQPLIVGGVGALLLGGCLAAQKDIVEAEDRALQKLEEQGVIDE